jgi:general secretion pathway protein K
MRVEASERGAALLTVLLLVAVISVLAASALGKLRLSTRLAENGAAMEQARAFAYAAETVATIRVNAILAQDPAETTLAGDWEGTPQPLPIPGGNATLTVTDGGNCFNLNGLVSETDIGVFTAQKNQIAVFVRLMKLLDIPGQNAEAIAESTADWIDTDGNALPAGAEDNAYAGKDVPYRPSNTLMTDPSEIRAVAGMTPKIYAVLAPWLCALPIAKPSTINVNTLQPEQASLLAMLYEDHMGLGQARSLLLERPATGYDNFDDYKSRLTHAGINPEGTDATGGIALRTYWFDLKIDIAADGVQLTQTDLLDASRQRAQIVSRAWSDPA